MRGRWSLVIVVFVAGAGLAADVPVAVSPGSLTGTVIGDTCPAFSWGSLEGARSYELVVYVLGEEGEEAELVLSETLPGSASSWTPSLDSCLERGGQYAWSVRALDRDVVSEWSPPNLFDVIAGPTEVEFEEALKVVQEYLASRREAEADSIEGGSSTVLPPVSKGRTPAAVTVPAATLLDVDGNVNAVSFTGDGSGLAGVGTFPDLCSLYAAVGAAVPAGSACKRVFVTSETYTGDLVTEAGGLGSPATGLEAGDLICQDHADSAGLAGTYKAWLSDSITDAKDRFSEPTGPWFLVGDGSLVATDLADVLDCGNPTCLVNPIDRTEGGGLSTNAVWTGTVLFGTKASHCVDWTSSVGSGTTGDEGTIGLSQSTDFAWTNISSIEGCSSQFSLYCFLL